ncbi:hypothetical protein OY671_012057, partial [Metschnikowia pulcherrima]
RTAGQHLQGADASAEDPGGPPSRPPAFPRLCRTDVRRLHAAGRRSALWRGSGDHRRVRAVGRSPGHADRPREGQRYAKPHPPQLRHGQARRLPQGGAPDGTGEPLRPAGGDAGRYLGRVPGRGGGGARTGRGHRPFDRGSPGARRA